MKEARWESKEAFKFNINPHPSDDSMERHSQLTLRHTLTHTDANTHTHTDTQLRLKDIKNHIKIYRYTFHDILIDANINEI